MIKFIGYFFQSLVVYIFFLIGRIMGIKLSRKFFAFIFSFLGPLFRSKRILDTNLEIFSEKVRGLNKENIISEMWKNYGMTFIEYIYLNNFRKSNSHITIYGEENLNGVLNNKKPAIFVSGHFANFELMSMEITKKIFN